MYTFRIITVALVVGAALPLRAQTLADASTCERAIVGNAAARAELLRQATAAPAAATGHFSAGCLHVIAARWDSASIRFDAAAAANPRSSVAAMWVANMAGQRARKGDAAIKARMAPVIRASYLRAIALDGNNLDAREGLMQYLLEAPAALGGDRVKASEQAIAIARVNPFRGLSAQLAVASAGNDRASVERLLLQATTQFPDSLLGWANLSAMQADAQRPDDAFNTIARWQSRKVYTSFALFSIGRTAAVTGQQLDRGVLALQQYLRGTRAPSDPPFANANLRLGQIYERQNKKPEARLAFQVALRTNPSLVEAQQALARLR
jgi:tetratricopeptide (TPR) repeat protein